MTPVLTGRHFVILAIIAGSFAAIMLMPGIAQDPAYHDFADRRSILGVPSFLNVISNLGFLIVGGLGLLICRTENIGAMRAAWAAVFTGISLTAFGSAYYHLAPSDSSLVWDRVPMTIGFTGLYIALVGEHISEKFRLILIPAIVAGVGSVVLWYWTGNIRAYTWIQILPLITIPPTVLLFRSSFTKAYYLLWVLAFYAFAKIFELADGLIFDLTHEIVSGHTIKHLLSAAACLAIWAMLLKRGKRGHIIDL